MSSGVSPHDATTPAEGGPVSVHGELARGTIVGRYEIVRVLGRGGMGAVYAGYDPQLDRQIALKLLHPGSRIAPATLIGEAKALARLDDPHVVQVFDAGEHAGEVFIAMQLVHGEDLKSALARRHPKPQQILGWFVAAGRGLAAAHAAGLIHRDFKPSNVLIDRRGRVAVTDFGLAVDLHAPAASAKGFAGTPLYMAPEQHALAAASEASDQFAFCVALWEALFRQHPYVKRDEASPLHVGHQMFDAVLVAPPRGHDVPRRVTDALTRGISRDPAARWPNMNALLAQLVPQPRRRWPLLALGGAAIAATGLAVWFYAKQAGTPSCETEATRRLATAWSPARAASQLQRFSASPRSYGATTAHAVAGTLDHYATRWHELASDACAGAHDSDLAARKRACLDASLDRIRAIGDVLDTATTEVVDHATDVVATLPELADCAEPKTLLGGPSAPPPALTGVTAELTSELDALAARQAAGSTHTLAAARSVLARAERLGWGPAIARGHVAVGTALALAYQPALDELVRGAELGIASHLDRDAVHAWVRAFEEAAYESKADAIEMLATAARSTTARMGDPVLALEIEIAYARALIQTQRWDEGLSICRPAIATADKLGDTIAAATARDCLFEGLLPAGKLDELREVAAERVATTTKRLGPDAPQLATYHSILADVAANNGNAAQARAEIDRALAVVAKAFPDGKNLKTAEVLRVRATVEQAEGNTVAAVATLRQALATAKAITPHPTVALTDIETGLALLLAQGGDLAGALHAFEDAIAIARAQGAESVPFAMLLLNYGQLVGMKDFEAGLRAFAEARQILERKHDPRASYAASAMAVVEAEHARWRDALGHAEEAVAFAASDPDALPANTAELQFVLARALIETHGDHKRALGLAHTSRATFAKLGPPTAGEVKKIDRWLATHR